ncbi:MAG: hypothetical protein ACLFUZ_02020 [Candidatus Micrarchaeia archaeon]
MAIEWSEMYSLSLFAAGISLIVMGLVYAAGKLLNNPRFTVWAKTEVFQVGVSIVLVFILLFLVGLVGLSPDADIAINAGWIDVFSGGPSIEDKYDYPKINPEDDVFETSEAYLQNLAYFAHRSVRGSRAMMGATDEFSKYTRTPCVPPWLACIMGRNGVNARPLSGTSAFMQSSNLLMYASTTAYLTVLAQIFFLRFIEQGALIIYLPLAIILRSLPFMRPLGGALIAICISLFLFYPTLVFVESAVWNPFELVGEDTWNEVGRFSKQVEAKRYALSYGMEASGDWEFTGGENQKSVLLVVDDLARITSSSFLSSTFLFSLNILAVSASAALFAQLLGAEVDLSRLVKIV